MSTQIVKVKQLFFSYKKNSLLLDNVSFQLKTGTISGLLGKNGEGKSTLLKLMSGLIFPKAGEIEVLGYEPSKREYEFLKNIYLLPEELPQITTTVEEYQKIYSPFYDYFDPEQFNFYLQEFGINSKEMIIDKVSLGQKKKILISFALAANTKLLLMDEPTNGLDIPSKTIFRKLVAANINEDKCLLISTHQVKDLESLIDNIIIIDEHEILVNETVENITTKLLFKINKDNTTDKSVLYTLDTLKGYYQVCENLNNEESKLDMEILFNAALADKQRIRKIFQ